MSDLKKALLLWVFMFAVGFYCVFVMQQLWNWFAVPLLHVSEASYLQMYGFRLVLLLILAHDVGENPVEKSRWNRVLLMLNACIPFEARHDISEALKQEEKGLWGELGSFLGGTAFSYTLSLGIGFAIHTLT